MKHKMCNLNWQGNNDRSKCGTILPREQSIIFQNNRSRRRISFGHLINVNTYRER